MCEYARKIAGWQPFHIYKNANERDRIASQTRLTATLQGLFDKLRMHQCAAVLWRYRSDDAAEDPLQRVTMDTIEAFLARGDYYRSKLALGADLLRTVRLPPHPKSNTELSGVVMIRCVFF